MSEARDLVFFYNGVEMTDKTRRSCRTHASLPRPHFEFLSCESYLETNDFVASHSGVNPACPESRELAEIVLA